MIRENEKFKSITKKSNKIGEYKINIKSQENNFTRSILSFLRNIPFAGRELERPKSIIELCKIIDINYYHNQ